MIEKELGKTGEKLPVIGLGTWQLGGDFAEDALVAGVKAGARFIDTAEIYHTEPLVGKALSKIRAEGISVFLATKVWPTHFHHDDVIKACEGSLKRLGVSAIDLYQLHWPNPSIPISETMRAMEELVDQGKIRYIGVSNFSVKQLEEARASMKKYDVVSNQVEYNPFNREAEKELIPYCQREKITVIAYSPLGHGELFKDSELRAKLEKIGSAHGKSWVQAALAWLASKPQVVAIPKASTPEHAVEDAEAGDLVLTPDEASSLDEYLKDYLSSGSFRRRAFRALVSAYIRLGSAF
ncbi:aldo/keto reductase [Tardisphaera miroshnichenkoae]